MFIELYGIHVDDGCMICIYFWGQKMEIYFGIFQLYRIYTIWIQMDVQFWLWELSEHELSRTLWFYPTYAERIISLSTN